LAKLLDKPFPLISIIEKYKKQFHESQITVSQMKNDYIETIESMVTYFSSYMDEEGRIIDPYVHRETQYSTPAFAAAAAMLYIVRKEEWMLENASKALSASLKQMVGESCADDHSNFYTTMVTFAYLKLKPYVLESIVNEWSDLFSRINPSSLYQKTINNWKIVALAGEFLRGANGLGDAMDVDELDKELSPQMELLTEYGLYVDPNGPLAYAMFTRNYFRLMLLEGYNGQHRNRLEECCQRGDLTSLFMQSPTGEMPTGGRSAQHQWNEAQQAFQFEVAANEYAKKGDYILAAAFKRGARLSLESINRWKRPSGELQVVKNFADPITRTGYERYTYHSQYNLLAAYFLALAYEHANDDIGELPCPAEVGGFYLWMEPYFHKLIINAGGNYIEYQTMGDTDYTPTGIIRIQRKNVWPTIGPSDGSPLTNDRALSFAPAWINVNKVMTRLSDMTTKDMPDVNVTVVSCDRKKVVLQVNYRGPMNGAFLIERVITVTPEMVHVRESINGEVESLIAEMPLFASDGITSTVIECSNKRLDVDYKGNRVCIKMLDDLRETNFEMGTQVVPYRNGMLKHATYQTNKRSLQYVIHLYSGDKKVSDHDLAEMIANMEGVIL